MALSIEALSAVDAIRRDLKVRVTLDEVDRYFDSPTRLKLVVELLLVDEVISKDETFWDVPG